MTTWEQAGFLSHEAEKDTRLLMASSPKWLTLAVRLSAYLNQNRTRFAPQAGDLTGVVSAALMTRALATYEGIVLLAFRGMRPESEVLLRMLVELMFIQRAVRHKPATVEEMLKADDYYRLRAYQEAGRAPILAPARKPQARQTVRMLKARVRQHGVVGIAVEEFARRGRCLQIYRTLWRKLCQPSHGQLRDLDRHFSIDGKSGKIVVTWGPDHAAGKMTLLLAMWALIGTVDAGASVLDLDLGPEWEKVAGDFRSVPPC